MEDMARVLGWGVREIVELVWIEVKGGEERAPETGTGEREAMALTKREEREKQVDLGSYGCSRGAVRFTARWVGSTVAGDVVLAVDEV